MNDTLNLTRLRELIELINANYGYDLGGYTEASLQRRVARFLQTSGMSFFDLKYQVTNNVGFLSNLLDSLTVNVTEMFRDPDFYRAMAVEVIPQLAKFPSIRIWHAGCATGEEAFSMAIMLHEAGILQRAKIYATDVNKTNIEKAGAGIFSLKKMQQYTTNYLHAGGKGDFSGYYSAGYDGAIMNRELRDHIYFSHHNLVTDQVFNEFQLICCRNVLIYFKSGLQARALQLFEQSLDSGGFLSLGNRESLVTLGVQKKFEPVNLQQKIFRLKEAQFII